MGFFTTDDINGIKNTAKAEANKQYSEDEKINAILQQIKPALMNAVKYIHDAHSEVSSVSKDMGIAGNVKWFSYRTHITAKIPDPSHAYSLFAKNKKTSATILCNFIFLCDGTVLEQHTYPYACKDHTSPEVDSESIDNTVKSTFKQFESAITNDVDQLSVNDFSKIILSDLPEKLHNLAKCNYCGFQGIEIYRGIDIDFFKLAVTCEDYWPNSGSWNSKNHAVISVKNSSEIEKSVKDAVMHNLNLRSPI